MNNYLQIIKRAQEQGLNFDNKHILIPLAENKFELDGEACFGRMFNDEIVYVIQDVDDNFSENGFKVNDTNMVALVPHSSIQVFEWLLCGLATIKRKPWKPQMQDIFWHIDAYGEPVLSRYNTYPHTYDDNFYKIGNCYKTAQEAGANRDKWMKFYASDEVLEV